MKLERSSKANICCAVVFVMILAVVYLLFLTPLYAINDDSAMANISYGVFGTYSNRLIFVNICLGSFIKQLMQLFPHIPWYAVCEVIVILASFIVLFFLLLEQFGIGGAVFPATVVTLFFGYSYIARIQFSQTAGIACIAGCLFLFYGIHQKKIWAHSISGALIFVGSLYRFDVFMMLLIPFGGLGIYLIFDFLVKKNLKALTRYIVPFVVVIAMCLAAKLVDIQSYKITDDWVQYTEYNALRSNLLDFGFPEYDDNKDLYHELDISKSDLEMFSNWNFADPEIFNIATMKKLVEAKQHDGVPNGFLFGFLSEMVTGWSSYSFFPPILYAAIFVILDWKQQGKGRWLVAYEVISFIGINLFLYYQGRYLVERIDISLLLSIFLIFMLYCQNCEHLYNRKTSLLLAAIVCCTSILSIQSVISEDKKQAVDDEEIEALNGRLYSLLGADQQHLYLAETFTFNVVSNIWYVPEVGLNRNLYGLGGWDIMLPDKQRILYQYGVANPYQESIDNGNVYFISRPMSNMNMSLGYIQRHYEKDAEAYPVKITEDGYQVYRILTDQPELSTDKAVLGKDILKSYFALQPQEEGELISGYVYGEGINSYAANIYIETITPKGQKTIYCATQQKADFSDDVMNGAYSSFTCQTKITDPDTLYCIYLETDDVLYKIIEPMASAKFADTEEKIQVRLVTDEKYQQVFFPVWTVDDGQDDLVWHEAKEIEQGIWECIFDISDYGAKDTYVIHFYGKNEEMEFITERFLLVNRENFAEK